MMTKRPILPQDDLGHPQGRYGGGQFDLALLQRTAALIRSSLIVGTPSEND